MKKGFLILLLLTGCASFEMPTTFERKQIESGGFIISAWEKVTNPKNVYHVYIEGDGNAFNAHGQATNDPTPKSFLMRRLAAEDSFENVIYLARPCQYTKGSQCTQKYWTTARFSPEVVEAEYHAIKDLANNAPVILIGYSGGAQIAGLMSVTKDLNIQKVITIAGNLDHKAWTEYHHLPPLSQSLNLADYKEKFSKVPQIHYVGKKDKVIPPILTEDFVSNPDLIRIIPNATHSNIKAFGNEAEDLNLSFEFEKNMAELKENKKI